MKLTNRWWVAVPLTVGLVVAACSGDDDGADANGDDADATAASVGATVAPAITPEPVPDPTPVPADDGGRSADSTMTLGGELIVIDRMLCFFEEQPRAGLGGVFTHTAQGQATDAAGEPVILDLTRSRDEDGTVADTVLVDIGDPFSDDAVSLSANGPEGSIDFGDSSASAADLELTDFESDPVMLSFDVSCG